jgi:hypothetical protein
MPINSPLPEGRFAESAPLFGGGPRGGQADFVMFFRCGFGGLCSGRLLTSARVWSSLVGRLSLLGQWIVQAQAQSDACGGGVGYGRSESG